MALKMHPLEQECGGPSCSFQQCLEETGEISLELLKVQGEKEGNIHLLRESSASS